MSIMDTYVAASHRIQTAIAFLMGRDPDYKATDPKHMRVGIDLTKSDIAGLASLLIEKGVFTQAEFVSAITAASEREADRYEKVVQAIIGNRNTTTV